MTPLRVPFLDLTRSDRAHREEIRQAIDRVLASGWYILGSELAAFEAEFAAACGARYAVGVGSGTDALRLALLACGIGPGDSVVTVPNTAVPTVCAIVAVGARPRFVDIDPTTCTLDPNALADALRAERIRPRAVLPVHLYGHPAEMGPILELAGRYDLTVIEDAAQAQGATYEGQAVGTFGAAGGFSFYPTKNLGAYGDAGMVVTDREVLAGDVRMLRNYGEEAKHRNRVRGFNSRLDELQAAILRVKLRHLGEALAERRRLAGLYDELLASTPLVLPREAPRSRHGFHLYVVRCRERDALRRHLAEHGIETSVHYPLPVPAQPAYQDLGYVAGDFPHAERATREVLSLPLYPGLTEAEVLHVCDVVRRFFGCRAADR